MLDGRTIRYHLTLQAVRTWTSPLALLCILGWVGVLPLLSRLSPGHLHGSDLSSQEALPRWALAATLSGGLVAMFNLRGLELTLRRMHPPSRWAGEFLGVLALAWLAGMMLWIGGVLHEPLVNVATLVSPTLLAFQVSAWAVFLLSLPGPAPMKGAGLFTLLWLVPGTVGAGGNVPLSTGLSTGLGLPLLLLGIALLRRLHESRPANAA